MGAEDNVIVGQGLDEEIRLECLAVNGESGLVVDTQIGNRSRAMPGGWCR